MSTTSDETNYRINTMSRRQFGELAGAIGVSLAIGPISAAHAQPGTPDQPTANSINTILRDLCDASISLPDRHTLNAGYVEALDYADTFLTPAYTPVRQLVDVDDGVGDGTDDGRTFAFYNHVTRHPNSSTSSALTFIICAHLDSFRNSPGANDNGSGVAALLELARCFSPGHIGTRTLNHRLWFVLLGGEEMGLLGSKSFCANAENGISTTPGDFRVINLDMIGGFPLYQRPKYWIEYREPVVTVDFITDLETRFRQFQPVPPPPIGNSVWHELSDATGDNSRDPSDHLPFNASDVPNVSITQFDSYPNMHTPDDIYDQSSTDPYINIPHIDSVLTVTVGIRDYLNSVLL